MKNKYLTHGEKVEIILESPTYGRMSTYVSVEDLGVVKSFPNTWYPKWSEQGKTFYVVGNMPRNKGKRHSVKLHRWIMNPKFNQVVDHINHDTLNNLNSNLRAVSDRVNQLNRKGGNISNELNIQGVSYRKDSNKFRGRVYENGVAIFEQSFTSAIDAETAVKSFRDRLIKETIEDNHEALSRLEDE